MSAWNLSPEDEKQWNDWVDHVRNDTVAKMASSAYVASLVPEGETDIKFAVELGLSIMLDKPLIALVPAGRSIPPGLRRVAAAVVELEYDLDTGAGQLEVARRLKDAMEGLEHG